MQLLSSEFQGFIASLPPTLPNVENAIQGALDAKTAEAALSILRNFEASIARDPTSLPEHVQICKTLSTKIAEEEQRLQEAAKQAFTTLPAEVMSQIESHLSLKEVRSFTYASFFGRGMENVTEGTAHVLLEGPFLQTLAANKDFRYHYYAMTGQDLPSSEEVSQMAQDRFDPKKRAEAKNIDQRIGMILKNIISLMKTQGGTLPDSVRSYTNFPQTIDITKPEQVIDAFSTIYAYSLVTIAYEAQTPGGVPYGGLGVDPHTITTKDELLKAAERVVTRLQDATRPITELAISGRENQYLANLTFLPLEFTKLNLTFFRVADTRLKFLPKEIGHLTKLQILSLEHNDLTRLPPAIGSLESLKNLYVAHNQLNDLPTEIGHLTELQILTLDSNKFTSLPPVLGTLRSLTNLFVYHNQLTTLPPEIGQLRKLRILNIESNKITSLPPEISNLTELKELNMSGNKSPTLPPEICTLKNLEDLFINSCELTALPSGIGQMASLQRLRASDNKIRDLPPGIWMLRNLKYLYLDSNKLEALSGDIKNLTKLVTLRVKNNQLAGLPDEITEMENLAYINVKNNKLKKLPDKIGDMKPLIILNAINNQISALPEGYKKRKDVDVWIRPKDKR